jgi:hypothetical protein
MAQTLPSAGWYKSSYSNDFDNACVEVARSAPGVCVRDSKDRSGPTLAFDAGAWSAFLNAIKSKAFPS